MKLIPLTQGYSAMVDDEDFEMLSKSKWCIWTSRSVFYARRIYRGPSIPSTMHNLLLSVPDNCHVDHRDGNGLNNQKSNLRAATTKQNGQNRRKLQTNATSRFKGVGRDPSNLSKPWRARIKNNGKLISLGTFKDEVDAATAYNFAADKLFGEFARMNTPLDQSLGSSRGG